MIYARRFGLWAILWLGGLVLLGCTSPEIGSPAQDQIHKIYLVRHAEKVLDVSDPDLTDLGHKRAQDLVTYLDHVPLTAIYTSDYKRTRQTAAPIAKAQDVEVTLYDPRDLAAFATALKAQSGYSLVVGHSNTTPPLSEFLGGEPGEPIIEATEYDRIYILTLKDGKTHTEIKTYGD